MDAQDKRHSLGEKTKDHRRLLGEVSWQEFWKSLDQVVDWNKKRDEINTLRRSHREDQVSS